MLNRLVFASAAVALELWTYNFCLIHGHLRTSFPKEAIHDKSEAH